MGSGKLGGGKREADRYQFSVSPPDEGAKSHVERLSVERQIPRDGDLSLVKREAGGGELAEARRVYIVIANGIRYKRRHAGHRNNCCTTIPNDGTMVHRSKGPGSPAAQSVAGDGSKLDKELKMEVTLRDMQRAEQDEARAEAAAARDSESADSFNKKLAALRERLDDLVLQVGVVQAELEEGDVAAALTEVQELWIILYSVDRRFRNLLA